MPRRDAKRNLRRTLSSRPRILLLDRLQHESPQTAPQLAESVRLHHNTVREHLDRLVDDGLVVRATEHRTVRGRPRVLFSPADGPEGMSESARAQTCRAIALGQAFRRAYHEGEEEPDAVAAQLDVLEDYLDRCGFRPRVDRAALAIHLTCPFGELRGSLEETLCSVDRTVMRSVLARVEGPLEVTGLEQEAAGRGGGGTCVLQLMKRDGAASCAGCPPAEDARLSA